MEYFRNDPRVSVEIEEYTPDLSAFEFVSLQGFLEQVTEPLQKREVRELFVEPIRDRGLSPRVPTAFGHTPQDTPDALLRKERSVIRRRAGFKDIVALKNGQAQLPPSGRAIAVPSTGTSSLAVAGSSVIAPSGRPSPPPEVSPAIRDLPRKVRERGRRRGEEGLGNVPRLPEPEHQERSGPRSSAGGAWPFRYRSIGLGQYSAPRS